MLDNKGLTKAEWNIMECLWAHSPKTSMELVGALQGEVGWTKSTTLTMLRRMAEKGLLSCIETERGKSYKPVVRREDAVERETEDFVSRVYQNSVSLMVSTITKKQELTKEEIAELYSILKQAEKTAK